MSEMTNEMATYPCTVIGALTSNTDQTSSACDRFFSIHELVLAFLHETETPVLVNCQGVCRLWKGIIDRSNTLQENLFLTPVSPNKGEKRQSMCGSIQFSVHTFNRSLVFTNGFLCRRIDMVLGQANVVLATYRSFLGPAPALVLVLMHHQPLRG